jgi:predicted metal-dependent hydrolase
MNVKVSSFDIRTMSCWGLCWYKAGQIDIDPILAKYPLEILEYVIVHEMAHLLVHSHSKKFGQLWINFCPTGDRK